MEVIDHNRIKDDSLLLKSIEGSDVVFHLAGISDSQDPGLMKVNVIYTDAIMAAVNKAASRPKIVFPSSFAVYRAPRKGEIIDEYFETFPRNKYGVSKLMAEELIQFYARAHRIPSVILRLANVYGSGIQPFKHSVVATFLHQVKNGMAITIAGDGLQTRDFIAVDDVVEAMYLAARTPLPQGSVLNICSGQETSINELAELISRLTNREAKVEYQTENDSGSGFWRGDNLQAKSLLRWKPKASLESGLREMVGDEK